MSPLYLSILVSQHAQSPDPDTEAAKWNTAIHLIIYTGDFPPEICQNVNGLLYQWTWLVQNYILKVLVLKWWIDELILDKQKILEVAWQWKMPNVCWLWSLNMRVYSFSLLYISSAVPVQNRPIAWPPLLLLAAFLENRSFKQLHTWLCAPEGPEQYTCHDIVASSSNASVYMSCGSKALRNIDGEHADPRMCKRLWNHQININIVYALIVKNK